MEKKQRVISFAAGRYAVTDEHGGLIQTLDEGDRCLLLIGGIFQEVEVKSGGYRGWYYEAATGERGRFALGALVGASQESQRLNSVFSSNENMQAVLSL